jgi:hypothetical protein
MKTKKKLSELEKFKAKLIRNIDYCIKCNRKELETMEMDCKTDDEITLEIEMYNVFKKMINNKVKITKGKDK